MGDTEDKLRSRIDELERRVQYLENETGYHYDVHMFEMRVNRVFSDDKYTVVAGEDAFGGLTATVTGIDINYMRDYADRLERNGLTWDVEYKDSMICLTVTPEDQLEF